MKKIITAATVLLVIMLTPFKAYADAMPEVEAPCAILVEKTSGTVLFEKDADVKMKPASVTKIMTLLLIMEAIDAGQLNYNDTVSASAYATSMGGSQVYLKESETMSVDEMLKCIVIASANDACVAMAEHISGTIETFVSRMNDRAKELGMTNTNFENCTGLDSENHYTTARDISIMSRELLKHTDIKKYTTIWMDTIRNGAFGLTNTNKLVRFYEYATGLKTGYTSESKYCISATAEKNGMELISVIMAAETSDKRNADAKKLLEYGFANYTLYKCENIELPDVSVNKGKEKIIKPIMSSQSEILIKKSVADSVVTEISICEDVNAPVESGQKLGSIKYSADGEVIAETDIIAPSAIGKCTVSDIFSQLIKYFLFL